MENLHLAARECGVGRRPIHPGPPRKPRVKRPPPRNTDDRPRLTGYRITAGHLGEGTPTEKALANIEAIRTIKLVEGEARTVDEQRATSIQRAFLTLPIAEAVNVYAQPTADKKKRLYNELKKNAKRAIASHPDQRAKILESVAAPR